MSGKSEMVYYVLRQLLCFYFSRKIILKVVLNSPSTSGLGQMEAKMSQDISYGCPQVSEGQITRGDSKSTHERKSKRQAGKATGKETAKRGNHTKETALTRQSERGDKSTNVSLSPSAIFQFVLRAYRRQ